MRVKTPVIPYWMTSMSLTDYLSGTGSLTPFPIELDLEDFSRYFWGVKSWRFHGSFTFRVPDVPGVSWGPWINESFDLELVEWNLGGGEEEKDRVQYTGNRFTGQHTGPTYFDVDLGWGRYFELLNPTDPKILWSGNHGSSAGVVKPGFALRVEFNVNTWVNVYSSLWTDVEVLIDPSYQSVTTIGSVTCLGHTFDWFTELEADPDGGNSQWQDFTATLEPLTYFEFRDSNGNNPVWNNLTGAQLIDPRTT